MEPRPLAPFPTPVLHRRQVLPPVDQPRGPAPPPVHPEPEAVQVKVDHRGGVQRQHLAEDQPADDGDAQRPAQLGARRRCPGPGAAPPSRAAMVVIMMGRKRSRQAS